MKVTIIFDTAFSGAAEGAVWIVESDYNRRWFDEQNGLDDWSAVFTPEGGEIAHTAILRSIWNVQEHYPEWAEIDVMGVSLSNDVAIDLKGEGTITETERGFSLAR